MIILLLIKRSMPSHFAGPNSQAELKRLDQKEREKARHLAEMGLPVPNTSSCSVYASIEQRDWPPFLIPPFAITHNTLGPKLCSYFASFKPPRFCRRGREFSVLCVLSEAWQFRPREISRVTKLIRLRFTKPVIRKEHVIAHGENWKWWSIALEMQPICKCHIPLL